MDPLAHSLVGLALAETPLARWAARGRQRVGLATAACLIGANAPDVDVVTYFVSSDFALEHRRGWTHGALAWVVLPLVLAGALLLWERWRRGDLDRLSPRGLLALSFLAVATHPFLDWLNTYGVRLLAPFDWRWFYGDAVFIVDPWVWLLPGGAVFLVHRWRWRGLAAWGVLALLTSAAVLLGAPEGVLAGKVLWVVALAGLAIAWSRPGLREALVRRRETVGVVALVLVLLYVGALAASAQAARVLVRAELTRRGLTLEEGPDVVMAGPRPVTPFRRQVVAGTGDAWQVGDFRWLPEPAIEELTAIPRIEPRDVPPPVLQEALASPEIDGLTTWLRYPFFRAEEHPDHWRVWVLDARYTQGKTEGFGGGAVRVER